MPEVTDGGPWRGPSLAEWLSRISPWPIPWYRPSRKPIFDLETLRLLESKGIHILEESEMRWLWGDR
jgi:hypothetical protein